MIGGQNFFVGISRRTFAENPYCCARSFWSTSSRFCACRLITEVQAIIISNRYRWPNNLLLSNKPKVEQLCALSAVSVGIIVGVIVKEEQKFLAMVSGGVTTPTS